MQRRILLAVFICSTLFALSVLAQDVIVNVNLTMLSVFVEDERGHAALDLTADDFEILENGSVVPVRHFALESEPVVMGLAVDRSSSIGAEKKKVDEVVAQLLGMASQDEAFLLTFAGNRQLAVPTTTDHVRILNALRKSKQEFGTRFYDALIEAIDYLANSPRDRKALVVFTDGADHYSSSTFEQVVASALLNDLPIFVLGYAGDDSLTWRQEGRQKIRHRLERLADMTGGEALFPSSVADCQQAAHQIADRIHYEYRIGFYSSPPAGRNANVEVRLRSRPFAKVMVKGGPALVPAL